MNPAWLAGIAQSGRHSFRNVEEEEAEDEVQPETESRCVAMVTIIYIIKRSSTTTSCTA